MDNYSPGDAPLPRALHLCTIKVAHEGRLYANGLQQLEVTVYVEMEDTVSSVLMPTDAEFASIVLVDYDADEIQITEEANPSGWNAQSARNSYEMYPSASSAPEPPVPLAPGRTKTIYLTASTASLSQKERLQVAFEITSDTGTRSVSNGWHYAPDGTGTYIKTIDKADVHAFAIKPEVYSAANFDLLPDLSMHGDSPLADHFEALALAVVSNQNRPLSIKSMTCTPPGVIEWFPNSSDEVDPRYTGYVAPGQKTVNWLEATFVPEPTRPVYTGDSTDKGVFLVCNHPGIQNVQTDPPRGDIAVEIVDAYGSRQRCKVTISKDEYQELIIPGRAALTTAQEARRALASIRKADGDE